MKKVGIIRCQQTEDLCPGTTDFVTAAKGKGSFEAFGECQIVGFVSWRLSRQACRSPRQDAGGSRGGSRCARFLYRQGIAYRLPLSQP